MLYQQGKATQAIEVYRRGLTAVPANVQGQRQQALQELAVARKLDPNAPAVRKARDAIR